MRLTPAFAARAFACFESDGDRIASGLLRIFVSGPGVQTLAALPAADSAILLNSPRS